jgi:sporulation protein YlmC with PRC-barrel domain
MVRHLIAITAVSGLMSSVALAQSPGTPNGATTGTSVRSGASAPVIISQTPNQWLGSKLMGADVIGPNNEKIGDVSDILVDMSGKVDALIVGVGGVLGIGAKDVAVPISAFAIVPANSEANRSNADQFRLSMTKEQLKAHAEFKALDRATTTGSGSYDIPH